MPYPQDLVGKYVEYRVDPGSNFTGAMALVNGVLPGQVIAAAAHPVYLGHPAPPMGAIHVQPTAPAWNFRFLKYVEGAVTTAPLAGGALMTGPMTGCYLCKYTQGGQQGLAHIGTKNTIDSPESIAAKTAWLAFVARPDVTAVTGCSPADYFSVAEHRTAAFKLNPTTVVGYFDGAAAYAILLASIPMQMNSLNRSVLRVGLVKTMTLQPWSAIAPMRRFRV